MECDQFTTSKQFKFQETVSTPHVTRSHCQRHWVTRSQCQRSWVTGSQCQRPLFTRSNRLRATRRHCLRPQATGSQRQYPRVTRSRNNTSWPPRANGSTDIITGDSPLCSCHVPWTGHLPASFTPIPQLDGELDLLRDLTLLPFLTC